MLLLQISLAKYLGRTFYVHSTVPYVCDKIQILQSGKIIVHSKVSAFDMKDCDFVALEIKNVQQQ